MRSDQLAFLRRSVPPIPRLARPDDRRPFWSVVVPTHNRPDFLPQTLKSVLDQDPGPEMMAIEVMDDCSDGGRAREIVGDLGRGRVAYFRHKKNLGQFRNVNEGIRRARGRWLHVLHDDDWLDPGFYEKLHDGLRNDAPHGAALTAFSIHASDGARFDWPLEQPHSGELGEWVVKVSTRSVVQTPAVIVRREVYETLGGYNPAFPWPGDWEMWQRIAAHYSWWYEPGARAHYRSHDGSVTGAAIRAGSNVADLRAAIAFAQNYLPPEIAPQIRTKATLFWVNFTYRKARSLFRAGDYAAAGAQLAELLRTDSSESAVRAVISMSQDLAAPSS